MNSDDVGSIFEGIGALAIILFGLSLSGVSATVCVIVGILGLIHAVR